eukprot:scaffold5581_cov229-Prasinococcus_capsulatus_cf.AAC.4
MALGAQSAQRYTTVWEHLQDGLRGKLQRAQHEVADDVGCMHGAGQLALPQAHAKQAQAAAISGNTMADDDLGIDFVRRGGG